MTAVTAERINVVAEQCRESRSREERVRILTDFAKECAAETARSNGSVVKAPSPAAENAETGAIGWTDADRNAAIDAIQGVTDYDREEAWETVSVVLDAVAYRLTPVDDAGWRAEVQRANNLAEYWEKEYWAADKKAEALEAKLAEAQTRIAELEAQVANQASNYARLLNQRDAIESQLAAAKQPRMITGEDVLAFKRRESNEGTARALESLALPGGVERVQHVNRIPRWEDELGATNDVEALRAEMRGRLALTDREKEARARAWSHAATERDQEVLAEALDRLQDVPLPGGVEPLSAPEHGAIRRMHEKLQDFHWSEPLAMKALERFVAVAPEPAPKRATVEELTDVIRGYLRSEHYDKQEVVRAMNELAARAREVSRG